MVNAQKMIIWIVVDKNIDELCCTRFIAETDDDAESRPFIIGNRNETLLERYQ